MTKPLPEAYRYRLKGEPHTFYSPVDLRKREPYLEFDEYMPLYALQFQGDPRKLYRLACIALGMEKISAYNAQTLLGKLRTIARDALCSLEPIYAAALSADAIQDDDAIQNAA